MGHLKGAVRQLATRLGTLSLRMIGRSRTLASLYYGALQQGFRCEHYSVLQGRLANSRRVNAEERSSYALRRNVHRLEKGLALPQRRLTFGDGYINETIGCLERCAASPGFSGDELSWACNVLSAFFGSVGLTPSLEAAKCRFEQLQVAGGNALKPGARLPQVAELPKQDLTLPELEALFRRRRSVRTFQKRVVPLDLMRQVVSAARFAPSACNRQPFRVDVASDPGSASRIAACAMGTQGFSDGVPCLALLVGDLSAFDSERDRHVIYVDASLFAMQLMLALETLGLSSCPINWPEIGSREGELARSLRLQPFERVVMLIAIGYADPGGLIPYSEKKPVDLLLRTVSLKSD